MNRCKPPLWLGAILSMTLLPSDWQAVTAASSQVEAPMADLQTGSPQRIADNPATIEPQVETILREATDLLENTAAFTVSAEEIRDVPTSNGTLLQLTHRLDLAVQRPNGFRLAMVGDVAKRYFWYDGSSFTFVDAENNQSASEASTAGLDQVLDTVTSTYGVNLPLHQLALTNLYDTWTANLEGAFYVGLHETNGVMTHHLLMVEEDLDWQIWVEAGTSPIIRKMAFAYRDQLGIPRYTVFLDDWNFSPALTAADFAATVPDTAEILNFEPVNP